VTAHDVTDAMKELGLRLARDGADGKTLAGCHLGLGVIMLCELHWSVDDILELVKTVADRHVEN
jgi:hypothetical protein